MSRIYWDTMLFVYWLEDNAEYADRIQQIYEKMLERNDTLCTSIFTLGELLVAPIQQGDHELGRRIRNLLNGPAVRLLPFDAPAAERYAAIRATNRVRPADAIHLASAAQSGVDLFLTNDRRLQSLLVPGIHFVARLDVNVF